MQFYDALSIYVLFVYLCTIMIDRCTFIKQPFTAIIKEPGFVNITLIVFD